MTEAEHNDPSMIWWMKDRRITREGAASCMHTFNHVIRDYAASRRLPLIDTAAVFDGLDRRRLQWDFAHFSNEGYELLAETMYEALRQAGIVQGEQSSRREELLAKYRK